jgi:hypothetical protein
MWRELSHHYFVLSKEKKTISEFEAIMPPGSVVHV